MDIESNWFFQILSDSLQLVQIRSSLMFHVCTRDNAANNQEDCSFLSQMAR